MPAPEEMVQVSLFCPKCNERTPRRVERRYEIYKVKGKPVTIDARVEICTVCGTDVYSPVLDEESAVQAEEIYRRQHGILSSSEIRALRQKYGLGQRAFSRLLGWGQITMHRYENGWIPDAAHNELLLALRNEKAMSEFAHRHRARLRPDELQQLEQAFEKRRDENVASEMRSTLRDLVFGSDRHGNRSFDFDRFAQMVVYFTPSKQLPGTFRVKLLKLLWYADFLCFKRHGRSISGVPYVKLPLGPVPHEYLNLLREVERAGCVHTESRTMIFDDEEVECYLYTAHIPFRENLFDPDERAVLRTVRECLGPLSGRALKDRSHRERAWIETSSGAMISYHFAQELSLE